MRKIVLAVATLLALIVSDACAEEQWVDSKGIRFLLDVILLKNRLYTLVSGGSKGHESSTDAARFRDSFRLMEQ